jgi:hypothetical protein
MVFFCYNIFTRVFRGVYRQRYDVKVRPVADLAAVAAKPGFWLAVGSCPRFALEIPSGSWPFGWVLFNTRLVRHTTDYSARLYFDMGHGFSDEFAVDISVTLKGTIHELVFFPHGLIGVQWAPMHASGSLEQSPIQVTRVGTLEGIYRMARRIIPVLWSQPQEKLIYLGLSLARMFFDLKGAYSAAGKLRTYAAAPTYAEWIEHADTLSERDRLLIRRHIERFAVTPKFVLVIAVQTCDVNLISRSLDSVGRQLYQNAEVVLLDVAGHATKRLQKIAQNFSACGIDVRCIGREDIATYLTGFNETVVGDVSAVYISALQAGDILSEHALYWMVSMIIASPDVRMIYSDEDSLNADGERCEPKFKPDWCPELLRSTNYIGQMVAVCADELLQAGGLSLHDCLADNHDLLLRVCDGLAEEKIAHVSAILIHRGGAAETQGGRAAVQAHLSRMGIDATVSDTLPGSYRLRYGLPPVLPMISILIPTRDAFHLLSRCIESVVQKSTYPNYEIIVIDNQSADADALEYLAEITSGQRIRVLRYDRPFNYSAINNFAAQQVRGEVLCLLNNDTEVISPDWIEEMLGHLVQDSVGVVGAKLLYPDGRVQHAGDAVGVGGVANHLHSFIGRDSTGYCKRAVLAQDLSAVTGACLMTWR